MVYDFGLMKNTIKDFIDSFDHAITLWDKDNPEYIADMKKWSARWVSLPVSPSAEQYARVIGAAVQRILDNTAMSNNEQDVFLNSVVVHETETGYAEALYEDVWSDIDNLVTNIKFSDAVKDEWSTDIEALLKSQITVENPIVDIQVKV
jgi:6-pyruvoyltetrahydropterin/6-carboxytetrahydropterin synthase